jgi:hypothetical protein
MPPPVDPVFVRCAGRARSVSDVACVLGLSHVRRATPAELAHNFLSHIRRVFTAAGQARIGYCVIGRRAWW